MNSKMEALAERLRRAKAARIEARKDNHQEVVAEGARAALPSNHEALARRAAYLVQEQADADAALTRGQEPQRARLLNIGAAEAERARRRRADKNPDEGFSTYEQATVRQYNRLTKNMKPIDPERYERLKRKYGEAFYGGPNAVFCAAQEDTKDAIDNMVQDLEGQIARRHKYSRRRTHNDDADVDYINERNAKFNKKLERFYGEHTAEIKQNLERGTAI